MMTLWIVWPKKASYKVLLAVQNEKQREYPIFPLQLTWKCRCPILRTLMLLQNTLQFSYPLPQLLILPLDGVQLCLVQCSLLISGQWITR